MSSSPSTWPSPRQIQPGFPWHPAPLKDDAEPVERAVETWGKVISALDRGRLSQEWSLRQMGAKAGLSFTAVDAVLSGHVWGEWKTAALMADSLGMRLALAPVSKKQARLRPREAGIRGPDRSSLEQAAGGDPELLAAAWHNAAIATLRWYVRASGLTGVRMARQVGIRPATWSQARPDAPSKWVSVPVILAVATAIPLEIVAQDRGRAWPLVAWEAWDRNT